jgi:hypothetical protein
VFVLRARTAVTPPTTTVATPESRPSSPVIDEISLQVVSEPPGASVTIAGKRQRLLTPNIFRVTRAPELAVEVELDGYKPSKTVAKIAANEREVAVRLTLEHEPRLGKLRIATAAKKAEWRLDGTAVGDGSGVLQLAEVRPGEHLVSVSARGYRPKEERIEVRSDGPTELSWELAGKTGATKPSRPSEPIDVNKIPVFGR